MEQEKVKQRGTCRPEDCTCARRLAPHISQRSPRRRVPTTEPPQGRPQRVPRTASASQYYWSTRENTALTMPGVDMVPPRPRTVRSEPSTRTPTDAMGADEHPRLGGSEEAYRLGTLRIKRLSDSTEFSVGDIRPSRTTVSAFYT